MKHQDIISRLSLYEKCALLTGRDFWSTQGYPDRGVPSVMLSDGPHGVRRQMGDGDQLGLGKSLPATCFPTASAMAGSWDPDLVERVGEALGEEAASQGLGVLLGPGLNIKRNPLCGRNFEYYSEDPHLSGKLAAACVRGIQKSGISACLKHFAANNTELRRQASDSVVDERTLREIYLTGFEIAVAEGHPKCVMSAYNRVNGVYANENAHLLQEILRDEWGFDGFVVSDWGANNDFVEGVRAGAHLEMPATGGDSTEQLEAAVRDGRIDEALVDRRVDELLDVMLSVAPVVEAAAGKGFDAEGHHALAREACAGSAVLLKNDGVLPLSPHASVAVIGEFARAPRFQGGGSSAVNPTRVESAMDAIGNTSLDVAGFEPGFPRFGPGDEKMKETAVALARRAEVALMYLGLDEVSETEGLDRSHLRLPQSQVDLLEAVSAVNPNVVVVLAAGSAVETPWLDRCRALLCGGYCGQAGAPALLDVITGAVNPSGHLAETWPMRYEDVPSSRWFGGPGRTVEYREGLYVGYRFFETAGVPVRFPFGHGLSYTRFEYSGLALTPAEARFTVANVGGRDGAAVAQLYVGAVDGRIFRPALELRGFRKVFLRAGERREIAIPLDARAFRYFNVKTNRFEVEGGAYRVCIGESVGDIRLEGTVRIDGTGAELPYGELPSYERGGVADVPDAEFERLLGRPIPDGRPGEALNFNDDIGRLRDARSLKARLAGRLLDGHLERRLRAGDPDLNLIFIANMPFRAIGKMTGGRVSQEMCHSLLTIVNGHAVAFARGSFGLVRGYIRQSRRVKRAQKHDKRG